MHRVFDPEVDPFIFDVSHQAYAHKLLTDRWNSFDTLREFGGICGYTSPDESKFDYYKAGHSSTSISIAVGSAKAIALKGEQDSRTPVALIWVIGEVIGVGLGNWVLIEGPIELSLGG